jgi:exopolyphosphatase / guanosine-5'-triphosphate,3'-diphosphate pyrophosphatase
VRRAVLDIGSNSVLLVVAELHSGIWRTIHEATAVTALGEGTKATGLLSEAGMSRSLTAIRSFFNQAHDLGANQIVAAATMAARIASNAQEFLSRGQEQGTPIQILSGEQEAELGFVSVCNDPKFYHSDRISIVDPGGHSTELVTADRIRTGWDIKYRKSFPIGTLGIKSAHLADECNDGLAILRAIQKTDDQIGICYRPGQCGEVVVLGAAGTNLISVRDRLQTWEPEKVHGATLEYEEVSKAVGWMMPMTDKERAAIPGIEPGREKTIHLGAFVLERFLFALRAESCRVSVRGWRHALLEKLDDFLI